MAKVSEVADGIYRIHPELTFMFSLSYLVTGEAPALIDPGCTQQAKIVLRALKEQLGFDPADLSYIIPTHLHVDHAGGAGYLAEKLPQAKVPVHERYARHAIDPAKLIEGNRQTFGENFADTFGPVIPVPAEQVIEITGGEEIDLGGRTLELVYSRGHANHHLCLHDDRSGGLFCGDAVGMYYPEADGVVIICPEGFDLDLALETIDRLRRRAPRLLYYAHEGIGTKPDTLMTRAAQQLKDCGNIVLDALHAGLAPEGIEESLKAYFKSHVSDTLRYDRMYLDLTVAGYRRYFQKTRSVKTEGGGN